MITTYKKEAEHEQVKWVLKEYDFYPEQIDVQGKIMKINCGRGQFVMKKTKLTKEYLDWLTACFRHLNKEGISSILPFYPNKYGDLFVVMEGNSFYVLPWIEDRIEEKYSQNWETDIMHDLAKLHQQTINFKLDSCPVRPLSLSVIERRWKKRLKKMKAYKQRFEKQETKSPLELAFLGRHDYLQQLGGRAVYYLQEWQKQYPSYLLRHVLCHGHVHRMHVLQDGARGRYFINFEQANMDSPARELALFYRRNVDMSSDHGLDVAIQCLANYEREFPLTPAEKALFSIFILFPEHIYKEIEHYVERGNDWPVLKMTSYFEKLIKGTVVTRKFIKQILA